MSAIAALASRAERREILDGGGLGGAERERVHRNLDAINRWLGGYATTLDGLGRLLPPGTRSARILDAGAGGGDLARAMCAWGQRRGIAIEVVCLERSGEAIRAARRDPARAAGLTWVEGDALAPPFAPGSFDLCSASLLLHHQSDADAARLLAALHRLSRHGVVINDLDRSPVAWASIWLLTRALGASPVVQHDGPVSVLRAFRRRDLAGLVARSGTVPAEAAAIRWRWAWRWQLLLPKAGGQS